MVGICCMVVSIFWMVVGGGAYIFGGDWWWVACFECWWMVVGGGRLFSVGCRCFFGSWEVLTYFWTLIWVVVGDCGCILGGGEC